ncbi:MAG: DUF4833 domain-containing protein [Endomicrobium sp.]|uniref:DUF4833 domain-containing protein n=1 Tax=Candidatus Endomicrobiellum pyrsonymphae TaxID=1408203 RepID=UPI00357E7142|nr:DUF4833 domain-containing protein [Endomicrobium sp.]
MKKVNVIVLLFIGLLFGYSSLFAQSITKNLFKIERNKNANVVMYDVVLGNDGSIDKTHPMDVYWLMNATDGQREEISAFEKKAYGYSITYNDGGYYDLVLKAIKDRPIKVVTIEGEIKPEIRVNDKTAYLSKVYVFANNDFIPKVQYIILTGTDVDTGDQVAEKINKNK